MGCRPLGTVYYLTQMQNSYVDIYFHCTRTQVILYWPLDGPWNTGTTGNTAQAYEYTGTTGTFSIYINLDYENNNTRCLNNCFNISIAAIVYEEVPFPTNFFQIAMDSH